MADWCKSCKYYGESSLSYPCAVCERAYDNPPTKHEHINCVEVRHGKWVDATGALSSVRQYECSVCGEKPILNEHWCFELTKYCPNCGAKMDGD